MAFVIPLLLCCLVGYGFVASLLKSRASAFVMANGAITILWMCCLWAAASILFGSLRLHEEGIVVCCGWVPGLNLTSWQRCKRFKWSSSWRFDQNGNLVLGRGWSRLIARVPPGQQEVVAAILNRKLGTEPMPSNAFSSPERDWPAEAENLE